jgi:hypothetical protein
MRILIGLLIVFTGAIALTMGVCELVFRFEIHSGEVMCGHNAAIQFLVYLVIGIGIVIAFSKKRH